MGQGLPPGLEAVVLRSYVELVATSPEELDPAVARSARAAWPPPALVLTEHRRRPLWSAIVVACRPKQWVKNLLVFAAAVGAGNTDFSSLGRASIAFVAMCLASSATYLLNDLSDIEADRRHPTKRFRPIAAGDLPARAALALAIALSTAAVVLASTRSQDLALVVMGYFALTTAYSRKLKHIEIVDICTIATGFVLRVFAGSIAVSEPVSRWLFIVTAFGALMVAAGKRASELGHGRRKGTARFDRKALNGYTPAYLHAVWSISAGAALLAYCLWSFEQSEIRGNEFFFTASLAPFAFAILHYGLKIDSGDAEEPETALLADRRLLIGGALWAALYLAGVYA